MGVHGLWRLIEPSGKPVPFETLENKVLAVDISLWLHQAVKGFQDSKGAPLPNAHLLGIYHRLCKLLYFRIKPVFVFDGGVPELKRQTIAKRKQSKAKNANRAEEIQKELLHTILKHTAVSKVLEDKLMLPEKIVNQKKKNDKDMFALDNLETIADIDSTLSNSDDDSSYTEDSSSPSKYGDLHSVDLESNKFKALPVDVRHEILTDLKETRKQSSWGRIHQIPKISHEFSSYQMQRLLKRQAVQSALEQAEKEMGGKTLSLAELESMLKDQGIITDDSIGRKIASDEHAKYLLVKANQKKSESKKLESIPEDLSEEESEDKKSIDTRVQDSDIEVISENAESNKNHKNKADEEFEDDLQKAIVLSLLDEPSTSKKTFESISSCQDSTFVENFIDADFMSSSSEEEFEKSTEKNVTDKTMASAAHYMIEYSGLTPAEISKILESKASESKMKTRSHKIRKITDVDRASVCEKTSKVSDESEVFKGNKQDNKQSDDNRTSVDLLEKVAIMSSSSDDSSDLVEVDSSEVMMPDKAINNENSDSLSKYREISLQVSVNTNSQFDKEDDLFSDIFGSSKKEKSKEMQITIDLVEEHGEDDLFSDIFSSKDSNVEQNISSDLEPSQSTSEIIPKLDQTDEKDSEGKRSLNTNVSNLEVNESKLVFEGEKLGADTTRENFQSIESKSRENSIETSNNLGEATNTIQESSISIESKSTNVALPDDSIEIINSLQKANRTGSLNKQLTELKSKLQQETSDLMNEKGLKQRMAENITDQMYQEAQDLLELFGVPYITAPMEAEAQCAFLDEIELTDGTITDDSDIWLFGGRTVYKNFFNQNKYVMEFKAENIEHHFKLSREQMILLALLVGSDYTNGLQGVGPVTALEILATFPPTKLKEINLRELVSGLREFRSWFTKGKSLGLGRTALKKKLKNVTFTENFPSTQVVQAYLEPKVETSSDAFSWGKPNFEALIEFAKDKFGWTRSKAEQIMNPVIQRFQESRIQRSIKDYFKMTFKATDPGKVQEQMSRRVKYAVTNMGRDPNQRIADEFAEEISKELKKKPIKRKTKADKGSEIKPKRSRKKEDQESNDLEENSKAEVKLKRSRQKKDEGTSRSSLNEENAQNSASFDQESSTTTKAASDKEDESSKTSRAKKNKTEDICSISKKFAPNDDLNLESKKAAKTGKKSAKLKATRTSNECDDVSGNESTNSEDEILNKIAEIRQRRCNKILKSQLQKLSTKLEKGKAKGKEKDVVDVPEDLKGDEDVDVLIQTAVISESKVENIYKQAREELDNLQASTSKSAPASSSKPFKSNTKQVASSSRTIVPKVEYRLSQKDAIPQKKQDQTTILRNKMKAIEVFRKGKKGPGYVPKKERKKQLPKGDAELSENTD